MTGVSTEKLIEAETFFALKKELAGEPILRGAKLYNITVAQSGPCVLSFMSKARSFSDERRVASNLGKALFDYFFHFNSRSERGKYNFKRLQQIGTSYKRF